MKKKHFKTILITALSATTVAFAGLFTWKYLEANQGEVVVVISAQDVIDEVNALNNSSAKAAIYKAKTDYDNLSDEEKIKVPEEIVKKLEKEIEAYTQDETKVDGFYKQVKEIDSKKATKALLEETIKDQTEINEIIKRRKDPDLQDKVNDASKMLSEDWVLYLNDVDHVKTVQTFAEAFDAETCNIDELTAFKKEVEECVEISENREGDEQIGIIVEFIKEDFEAAELVYENDKAKVDNDAKKVNDVDLDNSSFKEFDDAIISYNDAIAIATKRNDSSLEEIADSLKEKITKIEETKTKDEKTFKDNCDILNEKLKTSSSWDEVAVNEANAILATITEMNKIRKAEEWTEKLKELTKLVGEAKDSYENDKASFFADVATAEHLIGDPNVCNEDGIRSVESHLPDMEEIAQKRNEASWLAKVVELKEKLSLAKKAYADDLKIINDTNAEIIDLVGDPEYAYSENIEAAKKTLYEVMRPIASRREDEKMQQTVKEITEMLDRAEAQLAVDKESIDRAFEMIDELEKVKDTFVDRKMWADADADWYWATEIHKYRTKGGTVPSDFDDYEWDEYDIKIAEIEGSFMMDYQRATPLLSLIDKIVGGRPYSDLQNLVNDLRAMRSDLSTDYPRALGIADFDCEKKYGIKTEAKIDKFQDEIDRGAAMANAIDSLNVSSEPSKFYLHSLYLNYNDLINEQGSIAPQFILSNHRTKIENLESDCDIQLAYKSKLNGDVGEETTEFDSSYGYLSKATIDDRATGCGSVMTIDAETVAELKSKYSSLKFYIYVGEPATSPIINIMRNDSKNSICVTNLTAGEYTEVVVDSEGMALIEDGDYLNFLVSYANTSQCRISYICGTPKA